MAVPEGTKASFGFTANTTGTASGGIVPDVQIAGQRVVLDGAPTATGSNGYNVRLTNADFLPGGQSSNQVTFRLCTDASCATVHPGTTQVFTVTLNVQLKDWGTFQRDAAHTAYVAVKYDARSFAAAWSAPADAAAPTAIAARAGTVVANFPQATGNLFTKAFVSDTGASRWTYDLGRLRYYGAPSYANGRVISPAMDLSSGTLPMQVLDAADGRVLRVLNYASQFASAGTPVPYGDKLYHQAGYYGNVVYGYDAAVGAKDWEADRSMSGGVWEGESVAVDDQNVYFYRADSLQILSRSTGQLVKSIPDPFFSSAGLSYFGSYYGAPVLDGTGKIFTFSDNRGAFQPRPIIAFATTQNSFLWRTSLSYLGAPALRGNRLYAPRANSTIIDAIDTADGRVITSMDVGAGKPNLTSNVIVTENLLFVGSESETYAIDFTQAGNPVVWSTGRGGKLAITPDNVLVISSASGIYAYKLT